MALSCFQYSTAAFFLRLGCNVSQRIHAHLFQQNHVCSVQFIPRWYLCAQESPYALHPVSQKFPQSCLWNSSNVRLTDDGPLSSFQGSSSVASAFHAILLQAIESVTSLALCPQAYLKLLNTSDLPIHKPLEMVALPPVCLLGHLYIKNYLRDMLW